MLTAVAIAPAIPMPCTWTMQPGFSSTSSEIGMKGGRRRSFGLSIHEGTKDSKGSIIKKKSKAEILHILPKVEWKSLHRLSYASREGRGFVIQRFGRSRPLGSRPRATRRSGICDTLISHERVTSLRNYGGETQKPQNQFILFCWLATNSTHQLVSELWGGT